MFVFRIAFWLLFEVIVVVVQGPICGFGYYRSGWKWELVGSRIGWVEWRVVSGNWVLDCLDLGKGCYIMIWTIVIDRDLVYVWGRREDRNVGGLNWALPDPLLTFTTPPPQSLSKPQTRVDDAIVETTITRARQLWSWLNFKRGRKRYGILLVIWANSISHCNFTRNW